MKTQGPLPVRWVASVTIAFMGAFSLGLTGQYGFKWMPRWGFLVGLSCWSSVAGDRGMWKRIAIKPKSAPDGLPPRPKRLGKLSPALKTSVYKQSGHQHHEDRPIMAMVAE